MYCIIKQEHKLELLATANFHTENEKCFFFCLNAINCVDMNAPFQSIRSTFFFYHCSSFRSLHFGCVCIVLNGNCCHIFKLYVSQVTQQIQYGDLPTKYVSNLCAHIVTIVIFSFPLLTL